MRKKSGEIRVCLDPRSVNENIMRKHYHLPVKSELTSDMGRAKYFTKLDARMAFWQIPLNMKVKSYARLIIVIIIVMSFVYRR